ncbi:MAG: hypothetical protein ACTSV7_14985 [Candidatus Baldrarchaeia archaeon]
MVTTIVVDDDVKKSLVEAKKRVGAKNWGEFFRFVCKLIFEQYNKQTKLPKQSTSDTPFLQKEKEGGLFVP